MTARAASPLSTGRSALVVAHPGHELRVFGWMQQARPTVFVLTDGSGSNGEGRLESTLQLLERASARPGSIFGRMSDRDIYSAIMEHRFDCFLRLADELAEALVTLAVDEVVADALEGYNPAHDVCRLTVNAAVRLARQRTAAPIRSYDFAVVAAPDDCAAPQAEHAVWVRLDDDGLARKLAAARAYAELAGDVDRALAQFGAAAFRTECLRPVEGNGRLHWEAAAVPYYETYGEERVAAGVYPAVLRLRDHVMPLAEALWRHAERG